MPIADLSRQYLTGSGVLVRDQRGGSSAPGGSGVITRATMPLMAGAVIAAGGYPDRSETFAQAYASHVSDLGGTLPILRSYSTPSQAWPATWASLSGNHPRQGDWMNRASWHSIKPSDTAGLASGAQHDNLVAFVQSIPVTGYARMLTVWHEPDVGSKIPGSIASYAQAKALIHQAGVAIRDAAHPDVFYGPCFGSHFTIGEVNNIMAATGTTSAQLRSVVDFVGWDPYNLASQNGNYGTGFQGAAGASFYLDQVVAWTRANFPAARLAIGETGYRPNQAALAMRPAWLNAFMDRCVAENTLAVCYFDDVAAAEKENWIRIYSNPRSSTTYAADTASISAWRAQYTAHPARQLGSAA